MTVAIITGAASGLGWALARQFWARGYELVLVDRNEELLLQRGRELSAGPRVSCYAMDLYSAEERAEFVADITAMYPRIDLLVNNAGITHRSLAARTEPAVLRDVMEVDYLATVELTLALLPAIEFARGGLITIGSMAGWMPVLARSGYCAAKAALAQFFETLRAEEGDRLRLLMVYPSFLATPIEQNALGADGGPAPQARSTVGKVRSPEWMAERIADAYLAGRERLFPDRFTALSALLYRLWPTLYLRLMRRQFASELRL